MSEYSQKQASPAQATTATNTIGGHLADLDNHNKRLYELLQQLISIGDRLMGSRPEGIEKAGEPQAPSASLTMSLQRRAREQSMLIGAVGEQATRIEAALAKTVVDIEELRRYLKIDKHALDQELEEQPSLLFQISEAFVQAAAERDMLKEQLATADAKLDGDIRSNHADEKYTEAMVKNQVQTNKKHDQAMLKYLDAKRQAELLFALKEAFQTRGYMIRDLCSLYNANYFGSGVRLKAQDQPTGRRIKPVGTAWQQHGADVNSVWSWILPAAVIALIFYLACSATIGTYFKAKEGYINRLFDKLKGASNGKE